jgi:hypothetical protein
VWSEDGDQFARFHQRNPRSQPQRLSKIMGHKYHGFVDTLLQQQKFPL